MAKYTFTLCVEVHDTATLFTLAQRAAAKEGLENQYDLQDRDTGEPNVATCLQVLLDPGTLPGCSIEDSSVDSSLV